ncbi:MAG: hypothetical protein PHU51_00230 [Candidatus Nanoarchaeia archaeon]|nr:hypothetical protein [Candidatus Nanoarchaeia archaeon]
MKKASSGIKYIGILIVLLVSALLLFQLLQKELFIVDKTSSSGALCLASLKLQTGTSGEIGIGDVSAEVSLFTQKCSTIYETIDISRKNVPEPISNESNKKFAVAKKIADKMAKVWWMSGAGTITDIWADKSVFRNYLTSKFPQYKPECVTLLEFEIEDSTYLPETPLNSFELYDFLKKTDYAVTKDGLKTVMTYYDYLTAYAGIDTGKILFIPTEYIPNQKYTISLFQPPKDPTTTETALLNFQIIGGYMFNPPFIYNPIKVGSDIITVNSNIKKWVETSQRLVNGLSQFEGISYGDISKEVFDKQVSFILISPLDISERLMCRKIYFGDLE